MDYLQVDSDKRGQSRMLIDYKFVTSILQQRFVIRRVVSSLPRCSFSTHRLNVVRPPLLCSSAITRTSSTMACARGLGRGGGLL